MLIWTGLALAFCLISWFIHVCIDFVREREEMRDKICLLQDAIAHSAIEIRHDTIRDSIPVASQPAVIIDRTDYKKMEADRKLIEELNLRIGQVESENRMLLANQGQVVFKTAADSDSVLRYADKWCNFAYRVRQKTLSYNVRDSLSTIISRQYRHRFLWLRWGTKGYQVHIVSHNPNAIIEYNRYILIQR